MLASSPACSEKVHPPDRHGSQKQIRSPVAASTSAEHPQVTHSSPLLSAYSNRSSRSTTLASSSSSGSKTQPPPRQGSQKQTLSAVTASTSEAQPHTKHPRGMDIAAMSSANEQSKQRSCSGLSWPGGTHSLRISRLQSMQVGARYSPYSAFPHPSGESSLLSHVPSHLSPPHW